MARTNGVSVPLLSTPARFHGGETRHRIASVDYRFYRLFDPEKYDRRFIDRGVGYVQPEDVASVVVGIAEGDDRPRRRIVGPWKYVVWLGYVVPDGVRDALLQGLKRLP